MSKLVYGLDFGTTNTVVALSDVDRVEVLPIGDEGRAPVPSLLFFPISQNRYWVGDEAIRRYLLSGMNGRLMQSIKMFLPDVEFKGTQTAYLGYCTLEKLISLILTEVKRRSDILVGQNVTSVVMGRPGKFSEDEEEDKIAEKRLGNAARMAGFEEIFFQREPIAAAFCYETSLEKPEVALIADLGGGTSDFTIASLSPQRVGDRERTKDIIGTSSVSFAGDDFDADIMWHKVAPYFGSETTYEAYPNKWLDVPSGIMHSICRWREIPFLRDRKTRQFIDFLVFAGQDKEAMKRLSFLVNSNVGFSLSKSIERTKCDLTNNDESQIIFQEDPLDICMPITVGEFDEMSSRGLRKLEKCVDGLLTSCEMRHEQIDSVFLTGGTSQIRCVKSLLAKKFGESKLKPGNAFVSVATGLALCAKMFFGQ